MILVDASVIIEYLRRRDARLEHLLATLDTGVCGVTRAELLQGTRDEQDRADLVEFLEDFRHAPIDDSLWDLVGQNLSQLRRRGLILPFPDVTIATLAIQLHAEAWAFDSHFPKMAEVLPLRLYHPPP